MNIKDLQNAIASIDADKLVQLEKLIHKHKHIIILGNGGSNAIAQHIAQDYTKVLKKQAICFADASRLTCYINDYGMDMAYRIFIQDFVRPDTLVILISSSGESVNMIHAADYCRFHSVPYITLTGFSGTNTLHTIGQGTAALTFLVDSLSYGVVELTHEAILHTVC